MTDVTIERETLQSALDTLEYMHNEKVDYMVRNKLGDPSRETATKLAVSAIAALRAALAAQPVEPVARVRVHMTGGNAGIAWSAVPVDDAPLMRDGDLLYAAPPAPAAVPLTEPHPVGNILLGDDWEDVVTVMQMHNYSAAKAAALRDALETARNGLLWYRDKYPKEANGCDDEAMQEIDAALGIAAGDKP